MTEIKKYAPVDPKALPQTVALYEQLKALEGKKVMFGQQDTFAVGATFEANKPENLGKSDIFAATGKYPGVAGFDIGHLEVYYTAERDPEFAKIIPGMDRTGGDFERGMNIDNMSFDAMREEIRYAYEQGSIVTLSWHSVNPLTAGEYGTPNRTWEESVVRDVLPGGKLHDRFNLYLDSFIEYNATLLDSEGKQIPYIFRPFHEHSGDWFWWCIDSTENPNDGTAWSGNGGRLNEPEDFAALFRYTVQYLWDHDVHNLLYCVCPDRSRLPYETLAESWMEGYPGDDVIDIFGMDNYMDARPHSHPDGGKAQFECFVGSMEILIDLAEQHGKLAALTEMGLPGESTMLEAGFESRSPYTEWFLNGVQSNEKTKNLLYGLVWRNGFRGEDADPCGVYRYEPVDPADRSKGYKAIYQYSLKEDFNKFANHEAVHFVEKK